MKKMSANLLKAIHTISKVKDFELKEIYKGKNRVNNSGDALEYFVKDAFSNSFSINGLSAKDKAHAGHLAYMGNSNNPPDFVLKNGDAVEVKKVGVKTSTLQLNSSYPKSKLHHDDSRITPDCRQCDGGKWKEKEIIYSVGHLDGSHIKTLWFVYGSCYAADRKIYEKTANKVTSSLRSAEGLDFVEDTNELAGVRKVDPLGITFLRVRGMWLIDTPQKVFQYVLPAQYKKSVFNLYALIPADNFAEFPKEDVTALRGNKSITFYDVEVKSPNNPAKYMKAVLIVFSKI